jgi:hypothetical protein
VLWPLSGKESEMSDPVTSNFRLFNHMAIAHRLTLTESELNDIREIVIESMKTNPVTSPPVRNRREKPRTFQSFPEGATCPICRTNDDGETVLVPIIGTQDGHLVQCQPMHLGCAVISIWDSQRGIGWTK